MSQSLEKQGQEPTMQQILDSIRRIIVQGQTGGKVLGTTIDTYVDCEGNKILVKPKKHAQTKQPVEYKDPVNSPAHYNHNPYGVECIQAIRAAFTDDQFRGYLKGNVLKYLWRERYKNKPLEDVRKAYWYLGKLVEHLQKLQEKSNGEC